MSITVLGISLRTSKVYNSYSILFLQSDNYFTPETCKTMLISIITSTAIVISIMNKNMFDLALEPTRWWK